MENRIRLLNNTGLPILCSLCDKEIEFRYLDCEDCKKKGILCIYVCTKCGTEVTPTKLKQNANIKEKGWRIK